LFTTLIALAILGLGGVGYVIHQVRVARTQTLSVVDEPIVLVEAMAKPAPVAAPPRPKFSPAVSMAPPTLPKRIIESTPLKTPSTDSRRDRYLEALGSLSAAHLYQSYLNIGLLADGVESEAYTVKEAEDTLRSINDIIDQVDGQLQKLAKGGLEPDDVASIEQIKTANAVLRLQSKCLETYWRTGEATKAEAYHEARKMAWKALAKLMQLDTNE
jgi:hypothetical protein